MERAVKFIRILIKFAAAGYLHTQGWINKQTLQTTLFLDWSINQPVVSLFCYKDENAIDRYNSRASSSDYTDRSVADCHNTLILVKVKKFQPILRFFKAFQ
ncbi:hypothetical protein BCV72DRAFT_236400, partial [Rhizopus microsporus var. microsporus]